jgi:hypothetical protein
MNGLYYLAHLVGLKNNLNRERRRFYSLLNPRARWFKVTQSDPTFDHSLAHGSDHYYRLVESACRLRTFSKRAATKGYKNAQREMKEMTAHMRKVREEIGAQFVWGDSGNIQAIILDNKWYRVSDIEALANQYEADEILLGGE